VRSGALEAYFEENAQAHTRARSSALCARGSAISVPCDALAHRWLARLVKREVEVGCFLSGCRGNGEPTSIGLRAALGVSSAAFAIAVRRAGAPGKEGKSDGLL
jgi:hypothetical protein